MAGRRRSRGAIASSSRRSFPSARSKRRSVASTQGRAACADGRASLDGLRDRLSPPERSSGSAKCIAAFRRGAAPEEHLRVGDAGHRRQARLRGVRQRRPLRLGLRRQAVWSKRRWTRSRRAMAGARHPRRCFTTGGSTSSTTTTGVVADRGRRRDRQDDLARRAAKETNWATPFIWRTRRTHRDRHHRHEAIRSYGLDGSRCGSWARVDASSSRRRCRGDLLYVSSGYVGDQRGRSMRSARAAGDISLKPGETSNASIAWSLPQGGTYNRRRSSTATTTTRCSIAASSPATTRRPARRFTRRCARSDGERLHRVAVGLQRQDLRDERGRRPT